MIAEKRKLFFSFLFFSGDGLQAQEAQLGHAEQW
jgi:hypothetical protein